MKKLLTAALLIPLIQLLFIDEVSNEYQWLVWDVGLLMTNILLAFCVFTLTSFKQVKVKSLSFLVLIINGWFMVDYLLIDLFREGPNVEIARNMLAFVFLISFLPVMANILFWPNRIRRAPYNDQHSYLAYKHAESIFSLIVAFFTAPYSSVCLVVKGKRFQFKDGVVVEIPHTDQAKYSYELISDVKLSDARLSKGKRWYPWRNCYNVFRKYDGNNES